MTGFPCALLRCFSGTFLDAIPFYINANRTTTLPVPARICLPRPHTCNQKCLQTYPRTLNLVGSHFSNAVLLTRTAGFSYCFGYLHCLRCFEFSSTFLRPIPYTVNTNATMGFCTVPSLFQR